MTTQHEDLIMTKDTVIDGDLTVANIMGKDGARYNLTVKGNIDAHNIGAGWIMDSVVGVYIMLKGIV